MTDCDKCYYWPCDRTDSVCDGVHYEIDRRTGRIRKVIEIPEELGRVLEKAVLETLESEVS